nr:MAG TPA: hypothetical protein [Caudoviricetes sp.]
MTSTTSKTIYRTIWHTAIRSMVPVGLKGNGSYLMCYYISIHNI